MNQEFKDLKDHFQASFDKGFDLEKLIHFTREFLNSVEKGAGDPVPVTEKPINAVNQVVFEGHVFTKPHASLLQIVRRLDGSLGVLCRKRNVFDEFREFRGDGQFEQIQDWLDELIEDHDEIVGEAEVSRLERRYGPNWQDRPELWKRGEH